MVQQSGRGSFGCWPVGRSWPVSRVPPSPVFRRPACRPALASADEDPVRLEFPMLSLHPGLRPRGVRAVIAEHLLIKQPLIVVHPLRGDASHEAEGRL